MAGMDKATTRRLEAHVQFELARWGPAEVAGSVAEEITALYATLATLTPLDLVDPDQAIAWLSRAVVEVPITEIAEQALADVALGAYDCLAQEETTLSEVLPRAAYDGVVDAVIGMDGVRQEIVAQVTTSAVYTQLISHVLYHGLKNYVLGENVVVRRVPGASSLLRMGQNAVRSASPGLEGGIDRRLIAFVAANVGDTIRDSQEFLDEVLDDAMLRTVAEEIWAVNGERQIGEFAELLGDGSTEDAVTAGREAWQRIRQAPVVARLIDRVVTDAFAVHGEQPVATILEEAGLPVDVAIRELTPLAAGLAGVAVSSGWLEGRLRARLGAFYRSGPVAGGAPAATLGA
jgi:hypothetical protein